MTGGDEPVGEQRGEQLPRAVVAGRRAPRDGREDSDPQGRCRDGRAGWSEEQRTLPGPDRAPTGRVAAHPLGRVASLGLDGRTGLVAHRRLDASTELTSGARRGRSSPRGPWCRGRRSLVRDPVDVPTDGVRHRHVLGGAGRRADRRRRDGRRRALRRGRGRRGSARRRVDGRRRGRTDRSPRSMRSTDVDVAIVQHEYGIYGGRDGDDVLDVLDALVGAVDRRRPHRRPPPDGAPALRARARCATRPTRSS